MPHKSHTNLAMTLVVGVVTMAAIAPMLIALSSALLPLIIVVSVAVVVVRLVFFHTRRW
jgi:hypothetical protein